eukprot:3934640-Rhodomonas_salina.3
MCDTKIGHTATSCCAMFGTEIGWGGIRRGRAAEYHLQVPPYAPPMPCPVLAYRICLRTWISLRAVYPMAGTCTLTYPTTPCPVLTY